MPLSSPPGLPQLEWLIVLIRVFSTYILSMLRLASRL